LDSLLQGVQLLHHLEHLFADGIAGPRPSNQKADDEQSQ
jgi:hypothetical protein